MTTSILFLRSLIFSTSMISLTIFYGIAGVLLMPLPYLIRYRILVTYGSVNLWVLQHVCGIHYEVHGKENIPTDTNGLIFSKHSSTWETFALCSIFPNPQVWVLKRELLRIPFFGWALAMVDPIAIDRSSGRDAVKQVVTKGLERLKKGRWIVIFPEGTRVAYGTRGRYKIGGGVLAVKSGLPIVPMAHNAGHFWGRRRFIKQPGTVQVYIGPPIATQGREAKEVVAEVEEWIESKIEKEFSPA